MELEGQISFDARDFQATRVGDYDRVSMKDREIDRMPERLWEPELPVAVAWFVLPPDRAVESVSVVAIERAAIPGQYRPYPILPSDEAEAALPPEPPWDRDAIYPAHPGFLINSGPARAYRLAKIAVYPLEYNAGTERINLLQSIRIVVNLRALSAEEQDKSLQFLRPGTVDGPFGRKRQWVREIVLNPEDLDRFYPRYDFQEREEQDQMAGDGSTAYGAYISDRPSRDGVPVPLVIITNNYNENGQFIGDMEAVFRAYADKVRPFYPSAVHTISWIENQADYEAYDRPARIREFIKDAVSQWGTYYVLLGGDESVVPTRRVGGPAQSPDPYTDWRRPDPVADYWYARVGSDWEEWWNSDLDSWPAEDPADINTTEYTSDGFATVYVGRLPARNAVEAQVMTTKTLRYQLYKPYENDAATASFYRSATLAAGSTNDVHVPSPTNGISVSEDHFAVHFEGASPPWTVTRLYPEMTLWSIEKDTVNCYCYQALQNYIDSTYPDPGNPDYWKEDDLRSALGSTHFLYHVEHSFRDRLGAPSVNKYPLDNPDPNCGSWTPGEREDCLKRVSGALQDEADPLELNQVLELANAAGSEAKYFVAFSSGSFTNMNDMNSISEAFLRAPHGGAVAYAGKSATYGTGNGLYSDVYEKAAQKLFALGGSGQVPLADGWYEAIEETYQGNAFYQIEAACDLTLMADPSLRVWIGAPVDPVVYTSPSTITNLGTQSIGVTVRQGLDPVADALVCLSQADLTYARALTQANGVASFDGIQIQDTAAVQVGVLKCGFLPTVTEIPVSVSVPHVSYVSHSIDDCVTGGDCDGVLESGETVDLEVTVKNLGTATSGANTLALKPTPPVFFSLEVNGEYRPANVFLGKEAAHPPVESEVFRIPLSDQGIRLEGAPSTTGSKERVRVWRASKGTGEYTVGTISPSESADSVFTGIITSPSGFSDVSLLGEGSDDIYVASDSIWFETHGDATEDTIQFTAEAVDWLTVDTGTADISYLDPGDSTTVDFTVTLDEDVPDQQNLVFTLSAYNKWFSTPPTQSDFVVTNVRPKIDVLFVDKEFGDFGCPDTSWRWTPAIRNTGAGRADSVVMRLTPTAGDLTVIDSLITFVGVEPGSLASGSFLLCAESVEDTAGFAALITTETYHREQILEYEQWPEEGGGGCVFPPVIRNLRADLIDGAISLRWEVDDTEPLPASYLIGVSEEENGSVTWFGHADGDVARFEVRSIAGQPLEYDEDGWPKTYYFSIIPCLWPDGQCCGVSKIKGPAWEQVREREGWPKLLPSSSSCAPLVANLGEHSELEGEGYAIFAATDTIYAWRPDGTPLNPSGNPVFFAPDIGTSRDVERRFTGALAYGDWNTDVLTGGPEIVGNMFMDGVYLVGIERDGSSDCCVSHLGWTKYVGNELGAVSPVVAKSIELDGGGFLPLIFLSGVRREPYIYAWQANGTGSAYGDAQAHFAMYPDTTNDQYNALAIGYRTLDDPEEGVEPGYDLIAVTRGGWIACYPIEEEDPGDLVEPRWEHDVYLEYQGTHRDVFLSTPAVGDVNGDGDNEIVVTNVFDGDPEGKGRIYIFDENTGDLLIDPAPSSTDWRFGPNGPPPGPSLADLDGDGALEIVVVGTTILDEGFRSLPRFRVDAFKWDESGPSLINASAVDSIRYSQRPFEAGHAIGSAIIGETDKPNPPNPRHYDIYFATSVGAIFGFDYNPYYPENPGIYSKSWFTGWPIMLPDVPREPALAVLDPENDPYQASLIVQDQDGWLHVYDLPKSEYEAPSFEWPSYGLDGGNTRGYLSYGGEGFRGDGPVGEQADGVRVGSPVPSPTSGGQRITLSLAVRDRITLDVVDVAGRKIRTIHDGYLDAGSHQLWWDGRMDNGARVPSGIYWYRARWTGGTETERIVIAR